MLVAIPGAIAKEQASSLLTAIASGPFVTDTSSPYVTRDVLDHERHPPAASAVAAIVAELRGSSSFQSAALPAALSMPMFYRYRVGHGEHDHVDEAVVGQGRRLRTDIVVTLCLSDAASYDGGELVIDYLGVVEKWKGGAGDCLIYPADARRRALPITLGEQLTATFWVQSFVREVAHRKILSDFADVLVHFQGDAGPHTALLRRTYTNLLRQWAEPAPTSTAAAG